MDRFPLSVIFKANTEIERKVLEVSSTFYRNENQYSEYIYFFSSSFPPLSYFLKPLRRCGVRLKMYIKYFLKYTYHIFKHIYRHKHNQNAHTHIHKEIHTLKELHTRTQKELHLHVHAETGVRYAYVFICISYFYSLHFSKYFFQKKLKKKKRT